MGKYKKGDLLVCVNDSGHGGAASDRLLRKNHVYTFDRYNECSSIEVFLKEVGLSWLAKRFVSVNELLKEE